MTTPTNDSALKLFEHIAKTAWNWLGQARQRGLSFSEETLTETDIAALLIAEDASGQVKISKTTKQEERRWGIDWMWFIGNPSQGYRRYAVQAKKITLDSSTKFSYRIRYRVSRTPGSEFQIDLLARFAKVTHSTPLYCFYNNVDSKLATRYWHCKTYPNKPDDIRQMGCTIVPLDAIRVVHEARHGKHFSAVHQDVRSIPWRCLFHPRCGILDGQPIPLPGFLRGDNPVVEFDAVIQQLGLGAPLGDVDSQAIPALSIAQAIPEWFVVIESETSDNRLESS